MAYALDKKIETLGETKKVLLPPLSETEADKISNLVKTMSEFMDVDLTITEVRSLAIEYDADRTDVGQILSKIAASKKKK